MPTSLAIQEPNYIPNEDGTVKNPVVIPYPFKVFAAPSRVLSVATSEVQHTITDIPGHDNAIQVIVQTSATHSLFSSLTQPTYWLMLPMFFNEWQVDASKIGGIASLDIKMTLKHVMGRHMLYGLIVENMETEEIWLGATCVLGSKEKQTIQAVRTIGIKAELESKNPRQSGENVWITFQKRGLCCDNFVFLPKHGSTNPKENLDFENGKLRFGVTLITTSRTSSMESVTAMKHLKLILRMKDNLFFQKIPTLTTVEHVHTNTHDKGVEVSAFETCSWKNVNTNTKDEKSINTKEGQEQNYDTQEYDIIDRPFQSDWIYMDKKQI